MAAARAAQQGAVAGGYEGLGVRDFAGGGRDGADGSGGDHGDRLPEALDRKLAVLRSAAGDRFGQLELSALATFRLTDQRRSGTESLIAERGWDGVDAETVWQMPTIFIGSPGQIRDDLHARAQRFGLSYLVAPDRDLPTLATIIEGL